MPRARIDELVRILDLSFKGSLHSLVDNLVTVTDAEWTALPPGADRTIRDIVQHVGMFKFIYANHAFGDAKLDYGQSPATPDPSRLASPSASIEWLREGQTQLRNDVAALADDSELDRLRKAHWGGMVPTLILIDTMHQHDVYHAGEINRTRGMLQGKDRWIVPQ